MDDRDRGGNPVMTIKIGTRTISDADIITIVVAATVLIVGLLLFPYIEDILTPPNAIVHFYRNGTALLKNGTLIDISNMTWSFEGF